MDQNYPPMRISQASATTGAPAYSQTISSSPALYQSKTAPEPHVRRQSELAGGSVDSSYSSNYRQISSSYDSASASSYSMASGPTIPSISGLTQSPLPSPHIGGTSGPGAMSQYHTSLSRSVAPGLRGAGGEGGGRKGVLSSADADCVSGHLA